MTTTTNKGYTLPTVGADFGTWGTTLNSDLSIVDSNLGGVASVNCAGNSNVTASAGNAQNLVQSLTGALTGNISYLLPAVGGFYVIQNATTGSYTITVKTVAGGSTGITAPQGYSYSVWSDGTNVYPLNGDASGNVYLTNALTVGGSATIGQNLTVSGAATITGALSVTGLVTGVASSTTSTSGWQMSSSGTGAFGPGSIGYAFLANGANMLAANFFAASDERLKIGVEDIPALNAVQWVMRSRPVTYRKKGFHDDPDDKAIHEAGFLAQDQVRAGYGNYVGTGPHPGMPEKLDANGDWWAPDVMLTLAPGYQIAFLTAALQSALKRLDALEAK